jgi:hypothetical protein
VGRALQHQVRAVIGWGQRRLGDLTQKRRPAACGQSLCGTAAPPLAPAYDGPYLVLERSPHTFRLQLGDKTAAVLPPDVPVAKPHHRGRPARGPTVLPAAPSVPARSAIRRAPSGSSKRVTFATAVDVAPEGRPQRLRRPPDRFSVSSLGSETWGEV